jgi:hypothetical protein
MRAVSTKSGDAQPFTETPLRMGALIDSDQRLKPMLARETFFLTVLLPRHNTWANHFRAINSRVAQRIVLMPLLINTVLFVATATFCGFQSEDSSICAGGPLIDSDAVSDFPFRSYVPIISNSLSALMLAFYANTALTLYRSQE